MAQVNAKAYLIQKIGEGELKEVINLLTELLPDYGSEGILQTSRWHSIIRQESMGLATPDYVQRVKNQLTQAVLPKVEQVPDGRMIEVKDLRGNPSQAQDQALPLSSDLPAKKETNIYFSYALETDKERIGTKKDREVEVDKLYTVLVNEGFSVKRDKMNLGFGGLISQFIEKLGRADLIVVFLTDKYLRSVYCMWELCEIHRNSKAEAKLFAQRILPIRLETIKLSKPQTLTVYHSYWEKELQGWEEYFDKFSKKAKGPQWEEYQKIQKINDQFGEVIGIFSDMIAIDQDILADNGHDIIKETILKRIAQLNQPT